MSYYTYNQNFIPVAIAHRRHFRIPRAKVATPRPSKLNLNRQKKSPDASTVAVNVSVPGVRVVFNREVHWVRRGIWFAILVTCTALCTYQVGDRLSLYLRNPVGMNIKILRNLTVNFPSITICPYDIDSMAKIRQAQFNYSEISNGRTVENVWYLLDDANFTTYKIWELNQVNEENTEVSFVMKKTLPSEEFPRIIKIPRRFAFLGICMTVKVDGSVNYMGPAFVMRISQKVMPNISFNEVAGFTVYPHEDGTPALHHAFFKGQIIQRGQMTSIALSVSTFKFLNTSAKPCQDAITSTVCWTRCLEGILTSQTSCRLPFMTSKARNCTKAKESMTTYNATLNMYLTTKPKHCNCPPKCVDIAYEMNMDIQEKLDDETKLEIFFQQNTFQEISEVYSYGFVSLVCDIGGNLGFYLGFCLLTLLEILERFFYSLRQSM